MTEQAQSSVLVIVAHPDDPEFGAGGTIAKWLAEGREVRYVLCTSGDKGSWDPQITPGAMAELREAEQLAAARELGVAECLFLRHVDGELEANLAFRREISLLLRQYRPESVITHDPWLHYQIHPDHRAVGTAVMGAIAATRDFWYFPEQLQNGLRPHRVKDLYFMRAQEPNFWVDISSSLERKLAALRRHASQTDRIPDLAARMRRLAEAAGKPAGLPLAESFHRVELV
ncbi:MAG: PIG-L family deacetylase [Chloroflexi bacterium]|nr:PIG-L family deacetylase [Chloroflexota bacterium]